MLLYLYSIMYHIHVLEYISREVSPRLIRIVPFHMSVVQTRASCFVFCLGLLFDRAAVSIYRSEARAAFPVPLLVVPPTP